MTKRHDRPTVPSMPAVSSNPTAELRKQFDRSKVAIMRQHGGPWLGLVIEDGVAKPYTVELWEVDARRWLAKAQAAAERGSWIPTVCPRCSHVRLTPDICDHCFNKRTDK